MNPKLDVIFSRRSIRKHQEKPVPEESIVDLLEGGMALLAALSNAPCVKTVNWECL